MTILGHEHEVAAFRSAMSGERAPHAWLMTGPQGIGKASLALRFARQLLAEATDPGLKHEMTEDHPIARLCDAFSHPDLYLLDRLPKDAKSVRDLDRRQWPQTLERVRNISIEQVRTLRTACALKPSLSERRLIIVDSVDDMERAAANALLKILEEPPAGTVFLLISHAPGRLLPTVRSRCRMLRFRALRHDVMAAILSGNLPEASEDEIDSLIGRSGGSASRALSLSGLGLDTLYEAVARIAADGDANNIERAALALLFNSRTQRRYEAFLDLVPHFLCQRARNASEPERGKIIASWESAKRIANAAAGGSLDPAAVALRLTGIVASLAPARQSA